MTGEEGEQMETWKYVAKYSMWNKNRTSKNIKYEERSKIKDK
jgi:hypothetical protein